MISALFARIHSITNLETYEQAKTSLTQEIHSLHLKNPFHLVQYANTEFMSQMNRRIHKPLKYLK